MTAWFLFFALSGFCGLLYETLWMRLSMAQFGVTSPALSIVVSVFMAGLALGAYVSSKLEPRLAKLDARQAMRLYAFVELGIGLLSLPVPLELRFGGSLLTSALAGHGRLAWYLGALGWQTIALLPCTALMGATIPLGMNAIARARFEGEQTSFSWLYLANVLGAVVGTLLSAFVLIELLGFRHTLLVAALINALIGLLALSRSRGVDSAEAQYVSGQFHVGSSSRALLPLLFVTGFCSLGIEVVWARLFTPYLGTMVYAFALVLAFYLLATFAGSALYRKFAAKSGNPLDAAAWGAVAVAGALALMAADVAHFGARDLYTDTHELLAAVWRPMLGIIPFSAALGFLTPQLVDKFSAGDPQKAGRAYAVNTVGCILGPLLAGFILLPHLSERASMMILLAPFAVAALLFFTQKRALILGVEAVCLVALAIVPKSYERMYPPAQVVRDDTATTVARGVGMDRELLVNGLGMTTLTPSTKIMAHLPSSILPHGPRNALVICFGMGTTFRSFMSWGIPVTAVELVPKVPALFHYFHEDADALLHDPRAHVNTDDGRRFLANSKEQFDVIVIDPPPPVSAASSSLLYSTEFYDLIKQHLAPGGILQQWIPGGDEQTLVAFVRALTTSFPYTKGYAGLGFGVHILASMTPLEIPSPEVLAGRMPARAAQDLVEWGPYKTPQQQLSFTLGRQLPLEEWLAKHPEIDALDDDQPVNEYYLLRRLLAR